tara:strand:+ start:408 stop:635 length:228 start_codon:yes stop_codon:yes gene_type:complete
MADTRRRYYTEEGADTITTEMEALGYHVKEYQSHKDGLWIIFADDALPLTIEERLTSLETQGTNHENRIAKSEGA